MGAYNGSLVLLKTKLQSSNNFVTIGGLRTTKFILNNHLVDVTNKESGKWRELLNNGGLSHISISGAGIFTDAESEQIIKDCAFLNKSTEYELHFGNGDKLTGVFHVASYERVGNYNDEESYAITLESSGKVEYIVSSKERQTSISAT
jgi:TP901-1 family phage major tail protein